MGVEKSNEWTISYFVSFSMDSFMIEMWVNSFKLYLIRQEMMEGGKTIFSKVFGNNDIVEFL